MSLLQNLKPELATKVYTQPVDKLTKKTELDKVKDTLVKQQDQILEIAKASDLKTVLLLNKLTELGMLMTQIGPTVSGLAGQVNILQQSMIRVENRLQKLGSPFGVVESQGKKKKLFFFLISIRRGKQKTDRIQSQTQIWKSLAIFYFSKRSSISKSVYGTKLMCVNKKPMFVQCVFFYLFFSNRQGSVTHVEYLS